MICIEGSQADWQGDVYPLGPVRMETLKRAASLETQVPVAKVGGIGPMPVSLLMLAELARNYVRTCEHREDYGDIPVKDDPLLRWIVPNRSPAKKENLLFSLMM